MSRIAISEAEVREALLKAATEVFLENGIMAAEMNTIAKQSGLSRSTLYRYTISKNQLAFLVCEQQIRLVAAEALAHPMTLSGTGWERLKEYCLNLLDLLQARPQVLRLMAEFDAIYAGPYPDIPEAKDYVVSMKRIHNTTAQLVLNGLGDHSIASIDNPDLFASVLENTVFGLAIRYFPREAHFLEEHSHGGREVIACAIDRFMESVKP